MTVTVLVRDLAHSSNGMCRRKGLKAVHHLHRTTSLGLQMRQAPIEKSYSSKNNGRRRKGRRHGPGVANILLPLIPHLRVHLLQILFAIRVVPTSMLTLLPIKEAATLRYERYLFNDVSPLIVRMESSSCRHPVMTSKISFVNFDGSFDRRTEGNHV